MTESDDSFLYYQASISERFLSTLYSMKQKKQLCDVVIKIGNYSFEAHRVVLAAAIPYFQAVFLSIDSANSEKEISVAEIDPDALGLLINFAYTGKLKITPENVCQLLSSSEFLGLNEAAANCNDFLLKSLRVTNVMMIRCFAETTRRVKILEETDRCMRENFDSFVASEDFVHLSYGYLKELIGRDDLVVSSEESVFEAVIKWVRPHEGRHEMLPVLLDDVRMALLNPDYLVTRVASEELIQSNPHCRELVENAKSYHLLAQKRSVFPNLITRPRSYKSVNYLEKFDSSLYAVCCVEHVRQIVKVYDSQKEKWITLGNREHHKNSERVVASEDKIYIIEGNAFEIFCLRTQTWTCLITSHRPSFSAGVIMHCNMIYCFGGGCNASDKAFCFDPQQNEWLPLGTMPLSVAHPGVVSHRNNIYIIGGHHESQIFDTVHLYDPHTGVWIKLSSMLFQRDGPQCATLNNKIYVCGGSNTQFTSLHNLELYDPSINLWMPVVTANPPTGFYSLVAYRGKLFAVNEYRDEDSTHKVQIYNPGDREWKTGVPVPGYAYIDSYVKAVVVHKT